METLLQHQGDTYTYVSAIKALGAAGLWESAVGLLAELRELEGVSPDIYVYTAAISACSTAGRCSFFLFPWVGLLPVLWTRVLVE